MYRGFIMAAALLVGASGITAAEQTWTGEISDSICGAKHESGAEGQEAGTPAECTKACVKGGSKYVLVSQGKVYKIANQDDPSLENAAGLPVRLTGELKGDAITVSKIEVTKP